MNRTLLLLILLALVAVKSSGQQALSGRIIQDEHNLMVIQVWGSHEERGYAAGYLLGSRIEDIMRNYLQPAFGEQLSMAKWLITNPVFFDIDPNYVAEAMAMAQGVKDAGYMPEIDFADLLLGNAFLDIGNLFPKSLGSEMGCSSLLSWDSATKGTDVKGKSMITRHLDWDADPPLVRNQVMIIHVPSEKDEQPWLLIGFAGQMSVLSGTNQAGLVLMHHMMNDDPSPGNFMQGYTPIWFAMRKVLEKKDLNGDNKNNVQDVVSLFSEGFKGVADGFIISALAKSTETGDHNIAMIAELSPAAPTLTIRYNNFEGRIPGQNIYTANYQIARNNALNYCERYDGIAENIGDGTGLGRQQSWELMKNHSILPRRNLNLIQVIPEDNYLRIGVHQNDGTNASDAPSMEFDTKKLFQLPARALSRIPFLAHDQHISARDEALLQTESLIREDEFLVYPNPANRHLGLWFARPLQGNIRLEIFNLQGTRVFLREAGNFQAWQGETLSLPQLLPGMYILRIHSDNANVNHRFSVAR